MSNELNPRVFLTDLHAYNCGSLHGRWIDALDEEDMLEGWEQILATSPHPGGEEFFITDDDGFGPVSIDEYQSLASVAHIGSAIANASNPIAMAVWLDLDDDNDPDAFDDHYAGEWDSEDEYYLQAYNDLVIDQFIAGLRTNDHIRPFMDQAVRMWERYIQPFLDETAAARAFAANDVTCARYMGRTFVFRDEA